MSRPVALVAVLMTLVALACGGRSVAPVSLSPEQQLARYDRRAAVSGASAETLGRAALVSWLVTGDARHGERHLVRALELDPAQPWALLTRLLAAKENLDDAEAVEAALTLLREAPDSVPAQLAASMLREFVQVSPRLDERILAGLRDPDGAPRLRGSTALFAREGVLALVEGRNNAEQIAVLQRELGIPTEWTVVGPLSEWRLREFERPSPFDDPAHAIRPAYETSLGAVAPRRYPSPDGVLNLESETWRGDVYEAVTDLDVAKGGRYLLSLRGASMASVYLDGVEVLRRRALPVRPALRSLGEVELEPGRHRLRVRLSRAEGSWAGLALSRADGLPADFVTQAPAIGQPGPRGKSRPILPAQAARSLDRQAEDDPIRVLVEVLTLSSDDPDPARERLEDLLALVGETPVVRMLRVDLTRADPELPRATRTGRVGRDLDAVLARFPDWPRALEMRFDQERQERRFDEAGASLERLAAVLGQTNPRVLTRQALLSLAREDAAGARRLAEAALDQDPGRCDALELRASLARRDDEVAIADRLLEAGLHCPGGLPRLALHHRQRGRLTDALALTDRLVARHPASIQVRHQLADLRFATGDVSGALAALEPMVALWPRRPEPLTRLAHFHELAGNAADAATLRRMAAGLDGSDLSLARALALDAGGEVLDWAARDGLEAIDAYKSAGYRANAPAVQVLDLGALEVFSDGSYVERIHSIVQVLDKRGIDRFGEVRLPHGAQPLVVRTVKLDGRVLDAEVIAAKESISMPNLEPGDFVEFEYLRTTGARGASMPGFAAGQFFFRAAEIPFYETRYELRVPAWMGLELDSQGLADLPEPQREGEHLVFRYDRHRVEPFVREPRSVSDGEVLPWVEVGTGVSTDALVLQTADWLPLRTRPSSEIRRLVRGTASLPPPERTRAIVERVRSEVKGASSTANFREGAASILVQGRGNRMLVLKAALEAAKIPSRIVFARPFAANPHSFRFPQSELYSAPILRIDVPGAEPLWMDFGLRDAPLGRVPPYLSGAEALVMPEDAEREAKRITLPSVDPWLDLTEAQMELALDDEGNLSGVITQTARGFDAAGLRRNFEQVNRSQLLRQQERALSATFQGVELVNLEIEDSGNPDDPVVARSTIRVPRFARLSDGSMGLRANFGPQRMGLRFVTRGERETPLLIAQPEVSRIRVRLRLPEGWTVDPPAPVTLRTPFGRFSAKWLLDGAVLVLDEEAEVHRARILPSDYPAFRGYAGSIDAAQAREIALIPG